MFAAIGVDDGESQSSEESEPSGKPVLLDIFTTIIRNFAFAKLMCFTVHTCGKYVGPYIGTGLSTYNRDDGATQSLLLIVNPLTFGWYEWMF